MGIFSKIRRMLRGEVSTGTVALESIRRVNSGLEQRKERREVAMLNREPAVLGEEFTSMSKAELLAHFCARTAPQFLPGFSESARTATLQQEKFPSETEKLISDAQRITTEHCWTLLGFGKKCFGRGEIDWNLDPLSGRDWPLSYHADVVLIREDGSDARVVWELNRLAQLITLGRAYAVTKDETFSTEFFQQVTSWRLQNPVARGVNWNCAMEVALRSMNLLGAFALFRDSPQMNEDTLAELLMILQHHGAHIRRNLEYSHIATSNHYLCDLAGLLWLGVFLPELKDAAEWREFGLKEMLNEMDRQLLADGADYEASTGYHRLKTELFLYTFVLCHVNGLVIEQPYWQKLRAMVDYIKAYSRPDGSAPLVGDSDSGQVFPITRRAGTDHAYVLALGAAVFQEPAFKATGKCPEEVLWILGEDGLRDFDTLSAGVPPSTQGFPDAGMYVLRQDDLYLLFNASDSGLRGRGAHGHNDALSIEVSACGTAFIVDPGSYLYTADLHERHLFRSTAYHSTVQVDDAEQNSIDEKVPFVIGDEAHPRVISWEPGDDQDFVEAEHDGYRRLSQPVTHHRAVSFDKQNFGWIIEDTLSGEGEHEIALRFHFGPGLKSKVRPDGIVETLDEKTGARLLIMAKGISATPELESRFSSQDYGNKQESVSVRWKIRAAFPLTARFVLVPVAGDEVEEERLAIVTGALE
ncbi:MAG TPA: alginate lyase family protein [Pyrinomonadaceae bacterium]|nr:alginate lyase family protein [Pyrinomonadaceae bacterium]